MLNLKVEVIAWLDASIVLCQDATEYNYTAVQISVGIPCEDLIKDKWGKKWLRLVHTKHGREMDFINIPIESIIYRGTHAFKLPEKLRE